MTAVLASAPTNIISPGPSLSCEAILAGTRRVMSPSAVPSSVRALAVWQHKDSTAGGTPRKSSAETLLPRSSSLSASKLKATLLGRRASGPLSASAIPPNSGRRSKHKREEQEGLEAYRNKAVAFSVSSPNLGAAAEHSPTHRGRLQVSDEGAGGEGYFASGATTPTDVRSFDAVTPFDPQQVELESSFSTAQFPSAPPFESTQDYSYHPTTQAPALLGRSTSPQRSEADRLAARALTLAKLTEPGPALVPKQIPPRPTRPPPASPPDGSETSDNYSLNSDTDVSPNSSRFTAPSSRHSLEAKPSVTFADPPFDRERISAIPVGRVYGERRMAESAIDLLSVVEEDESATRSGRDVQLRMSQPIVSRSPSSPPRRPTRLSLEAGPSLWLDGGALPVPKRKRHSSEIGRPLRLSMKRSFSAGNSEPSKLDLAESGPIEMEPALIRSVSSKVARRSRSSSPAPPPLPVASSSFSVPFPSQSLQSNQDSSIGLGSPPARPRAHKRWNSEIHIEQLSAVLQNNPVPRSRHESVAVAPTEAIKSSPVPRTKLVLREHGRPMLTYQLGECIGRGQFGSVYRALNLTTGQVVAVKRIQLEGKTEEEISQLSNEVSLLKRLSHASVVKYEGVVRTEHYLNILLEYVENGSLLKTLKHFGDLPEALVASYVVKILEGLHYLHQSSVVHCDLKAANILSTKSGNIKLSDFGVSLNLQAVQNIQRDDVAGTPNWMAPEVIELKGASTASDIWSLACTVIELITGKPPYSDLNAMSTMFRIVEDACPPIPARCSPDLNDFLRRCFAKEPEERPSAGALFLHPWLQRSWEALKNLRPQDSIPFIRRVSNDARRHTQDGYPSNSFATLIEHDFFTTSPISPPSVPVFPDLGSSTGVQNGAPLQMIRTDSSDIQATAGQDPGLDMNRPHGFIKTTFSKAVTCSICGEETKRHASLCPSCGTIAHQRCCAFVPLPCDLRTQLLGKRTTGPPRPALQPSTPSFPLSGFTVIIPFRRSKQSPDLGSSSSIPKANSLPSASRETSSAGSDTHGREEPATVKDGSVGSARSRLRNSLSMGTSDGHRSAMSLLVGRKSSDMGTRPSPALLRKQSTASTSGHKKLFRQKSHSRSHSNPPVKDKSGSDCIVQ